MPSPTLIPLVTACAVATGGLTILRARRHPERVALVLIAVAALLAFLIGVVVLARMDYEAPQDADMGPVVIAMMVSDRG